MKEGLLIYGCYGYTGKLISEHAVKCGLKPVLAGRDEKKVKSLAAELNLSFRVFDLSDEQKIIINIADVKVVMHCAGPFITTAQIMAGACIKAATHYLDITGEYEVYEKLFSMNKAAQKAGVLLMPGVGFDVVPSDCLALYLKEKLPSAYSLELVLRVINGKLSGGTAITIIENIVEGGVIRRKGKLKKVANGELTRVIDWGDKKRQTAAIPWGDVATAFRSTGIPDITVYISLPQIVVAIMKMGNYTNFIFRLKAVKKSITWLLKKLPAGPDAESRSKSKCIIWGEVKNTSGETHRAILELPETYTLTSWTSVKIAQHILASEPPHGTITPAQVFGKDFILQFDGVKRMDMD